MAKQASTYGYGSSDAWAFGPGTKSPARVHTEPVHTQPANSEPMPVVDTAPASQYRSEYQQPAVFSYERPAVFLTEPSEPSAAERDVWDQLPPERPKRGGRYVGKHRA
ncbi:MAG TPA: hypothetical protein VHH92_00120 [Actinomycetota bacterium]|nr:hypothetical protein [Actinomycetota bacterium]